MEYLKCSANWFQAFSNDCACISCRKKQKAFGESKPKVHTTPWRRTLSHLPGEIEAIEAGIYEDKEANTIIDNSGAL